MSKANLLRAVTQRLNQTPVKELPHIANSLASSVLSCANILKSDSGPASKDDDIAFQVHKLKARITSLLQDRSAEGRFTAVVLVKAITHIGGRETLASCEPWLRGMLATLSRQDPASLKNLCILTTTQIFLLTQHYPTLIREITTPLLPAFVTACMNLGALHPTQGDEGPSARPSPCLETVLQCMLHLIPRHPSTFRPFTTKLSATLIKFIGSPSNPEHLTHLAQSLFVTLHFCAPKNTGADKWKHACEAVIASIHSIADQILRAIIEDWKPSNSRRVEPLVCMTFDEMPHSIEGGALDLPSCHRVYYGSKVLVSLLHLLRTFLVSQTSYSVELPLGLILDLTSRLSSMRVPANGKQNLASTRFNPEIEWSERELLLAVLPEIQISTLNLLSDLVDVTGLSVLSVSPIVLDQCLWVFDSGSSSEDVRLAAYELLERLTPLAGTSMMKGGLKPFFEVADLCCKDVGAKSYEKGMTDQSNARPNANPAVTGHADSFLQNVQKRRFKREYHTFLIEDAASRLLGQILGHLPAQSIPSSLRAQIDRAIILNDEKYAMLASVLNPPPGKTGKFATPSILPFLARTSQNELEFEGLLRPRMPPIWEPRIPPSGSQVDPAEDMEGKNFKNHGKADKPDHRAFTESSAHQLGIENDLLDRLEDSIADRPRTNSEAGTPQNISAHQPVIDSTWEGKDDAPHTNGFVQGIKRGIDKSNVQVQQESNKRFRSSGLEREPVTTSPPKETIAGTFATSSIAVDSGATVSVDAGAGASVIDKGKGKATAASPRLGGLGMPDSEEVGDEESGSDLPPLYLKTSSEEEDEDK